MKLDEAGNVKLYLVDGNNPTGYAQVLQEMATIGGLIRSYTLGLDVVSQWDSTNGLAYLLYDGHGSTRATLNASGSVLPRYLYDAYGNMLSGTGYVGLTSAANAITSLLYSGEQTDRATGLQYLRARYCDSPPLSDSGGLSHTAEEFERILAKVSEVRSRETNVWQHYLRGLWLSGLGLEESTILSWDQDAPFTIDLSGRHPRFRIFAEAEKGRRDRLLPMTPDFAEFILQTPSHQREGHVFRLVGGRTRKQMTSARVGRIISEIGRLAGVVVNKADQKYASAHDLRRSFGTRWAPRVKPATLQLLMRHKSIETTMKYYVGQDADDVADELWAEYESVRQKSRARGSSPLGCAS